MMAASFKEDEAIRLVMFVKAYFKEDEVFRIKDLAQLLFADKRKIKDKIKMISNKDLAGIKIFRVGNTKANSWYYRKSGQRCGVLKPISGGIGFS